MPCWRIGHDMPLPKLEKRHHSRTLCRSSLYLLWQKNKLIHHHYMDPSLNGNNVCKSNQSALRCSLSYSEKYNLIGTKIHMERQSATEKALYTLYDAVFQACFSKKWSSCEGSHQSSNQQATAHLERMGIASWLCCRRRAFGIPHGVGCTGDSNKGILFAACGIAVENLTREVVTLCGISYIAIAWVNIAPRPLAPIRLLAEWLPIRRILGNVHARRSGVPPDLAGRTKVSCGIGEVLANSC